MRRFLSAHGDWLYLVALVLLFAALRIDLSARAAPSNRILLPSVFQPPPATICDGSPLSDTDVGALSAIRDPSGRYIIAIQNRYNGSRAEVDQHVGNHLEAIPAPLAQAFAAPAFSPEGAKHGALALVAGATPGDKNRLYYTARDAGATEGAYKPRCVDF